MKREYIGVDTPDGYLEGWVKTGADLDGEFVIDTEDGKFTVNGWMLGPDDINIEVIK